MTPTEIIELSKLGFDVIAEIIKLVKDAQSGKLAAPVAKSDLEALRKSLHDRLAAGDERVDEYIDKKFDK